MSAAPVLNVHDSTLLSAAYNGDIGAFEELFNRHYPRVYGVIFKITGNAEDAEEIALDVFLRLHQQRLPADEDVNVAGWLYRTATNAGFNSIRSRKRRLGWLRKFARFRPTINREVDNPESVLERREDAELVRHVLASLPERQRNALILKASGFKYVEIAEVIGVKPTSIGTILARGERSFRRQMMNESDAKC